MRRLAVTVALCACLGLTACQTTQELSAQRGKNAKKLGQQRKLSIGRLNPDIKVRTTALLQDKNGIAAVVEMKNTGARAQVGVPLAITVTNAQGKALYRNDTAGLEASLVSFPVLEKREDVFWVHNQVTVAGKPAGVTARVGTSKGAAPAQVPTFRISGAKVDRDSDGTYAKATIANASKVAQRNLVVFCVARKGGKIVAAGRAIIESLPPQGAAPTQFTVFFIGDPQGGKLSFSAPATVLR